MPEPLTARQLEVVRAYVDAGGAKGAARELQLSTRAVETTLTRARAKVDVQTTVQLVRELVRPGEL